MRFSWGEGLLLFGILLQLFWDDKELRANFIVVMIGLVRVGAIFWLFFKIKQKFENFSITAIPAIVVFCWIFLYLPFIGILPSAIIYLSE